MYEFPFFGPFIFLNCTDHRVGVCKLNKSELMLSIRFDILNSESVQDSTKRAKYGF